LTEFVDQVFLPWAKAERKSWRTVESYCKALKKAFGKRGMRDLTEVAIRQYRRERLTVKTTRGDRKPAAVDREIELLRRVFSIAIERGLLRENPCSKIKPLARNSGIVRYMTEEEQAKLMVVLDEPRRSRLRDIFLIDLHTGLRKSELLSLHKSQVDFLRKRIILTKTKSGQPRAVPIHVEILPILQRLCQTTNDYLFPSRKTGGPIKDIKTAWHRALADAGIDPLPFHCAGRHTFATRAMTGGASPVDLQAVLGHSDFKTTLRYAHATEEGQRRAVEAAARRESGRNVAEMEKAAG
jgi:integrase